MTLYEKIAELINNTPNFPVSVTEKEYAYYLLKYPFLNGIEAKRVLESAGYWFHKYSKNPDYILIPKDEFLHNLFFGK